MSHKKTKAMKAPEITFNESEKEALHYERFHHPHPRVQKKMEVLWLKSQGLAQMEIARLVKTDRRTVGLYVKAYAEGGIERLKQINFRRAESKLMAHRATLEAHFRAHPPATVNQAVADIELLTGIKRSPTQVRIFLKACGMKRLKTGVLPAKADVEKQAAFKKTNSNPA